MPPPRGARDDAGLPRRAGIGFKPRHLPELLADPDRPAFVEVHAENYMGDGGAPHAWLAQVRETMRLSLHGVGLSIGGTAPPDETHLSRLAALIARHEPAAFSEHVAWSSHGGTFFNDLLPLRYDNRTLRRVCAHVDAVQSRLRLRLLLENPSSYVAFEGSTWCEAAFLSEVARRTGCALLLDVNNVHVSCTNLDRDPHDYLSALPLHAVAQIHLAGHAIEPGIDDTPLLIDDHGSPVATPVWDLYVSVLSRCGPLPTLVEWDTRVPDYAVLRAEARQAQALLDACAASRSGWRDAAVTGAAA